MNASITHKLNSLARRYEKLNALLSDSDIIAQTDRFRDLSKEYAQLEPVVKCFQQYQQTYIDHNHAEELLQESDMELHKLAEEELKRTKQQLTDLEQQLKILLLPSDPNDAHNVFLEIRAGTGGDEAAIFVGDLFIMYTRYAELMNWRLETLTEHFGEHGGYKEIITRVIGKNVYSQLKFESGVHRVQRVPITESQGRVHTSACTVAILPEVEAVDAIEIDNKDLRIDTFRASGAGGQHVNKTDSAIRITHLPTGVVVECQDERSQHKNRARAMSLLQARLLATEQQKQQQQQTAARRSLVGSGDRSERIRTYNYPQGRLTDHRINLTLYKLPEIMAGGLEVVIDALISEHQADKLANFAMDE